MAWLVSRAASAAARAVASSAAGVTVSRVVSSPMAQSVYASATAAAARAAGGVGTAFAAAMTAMRDPKGERRALTDKILTELVEPLITLKNHHALMHLYNMLVLVSVACRPERGGAYRDLEERLAFFLQRLLSLPLPAAQQLATEIFVLATHHLDPTHNPSATFNDYTVWAAKVASGARDGNLTKSMSRIVGRIYMALHDRELSGLMGVASYGLLPAAVVPAPLPGTEIGAMVPPSYFRFEPAQLASENAAQYLQGRVVIAPSVYHVPKGLLDDGPRFQFDADLDEVAFSLTAGDPVVLLRALMAAKVISLPLRWHVDFSELVKMSSKEPTIELYRAWEALIGRIEVNPKAPRLNILSQLVSCTGLPDFVPLLLVKHLADRKVTLNKLFSLEDAQLVYAAYNSQLSFLGGDKEAKFKFIPREQASSLASLCHLFHVAKEDCAFTKELTTLLSAYFSYLHLFVPRALRGEVYASHPVTGAQLTELCFLYRVVGAGTDATDVYAKIDTAFRTAFRFDEKDTFWMSSVLQSLDEDMSGASSAPGVGALLRYLTSASGAGAHVSSAYPITVLHAGPSAEAGGRAVFVSLSHSVGALPQSPHGGVVDVGSEMMPMHVVARVPATQRAPVLPLPPRSFAAAFSAAAAAAAAPPPPPSARAVQGVDDWAITASEGFGVVIGGVTVTPPPPAPKDAESESDAEVVEDEVRALGREGLAALAAHQAAAPAEAEAAPAKAEAEVAPDDSAALPNIDDEFTMVVGDTPPLQVAAPPPAPSAPATPKASGKPAAKSGGGSKRGKAHR